MVKRLFLIESNAARSSLIRLVVKVFLILAFRKISKTKMTTKTMTMPIINSFFISVCGYAAIRSGVTATKQSSVFKPDDNLASAKGEAVFGNLNFMTHGS